MFFVGWIPLIWISTVGSCARRLQRMSKEPVLADQFFDSRTFVDAFGPMAEDFAVT